jgi:hypothetical protein
MLTDAQVAERHRQSSSTRARATLFAPTSLRGAPGWSVCLLSCAASKIASSTLPERGGYSGGEHRQCIDVGHAELSDAPPAPEPCRAGDWLDVRFWGLSGHGRLQCKCPLLTQSRHKLVRCTCPLLGVKRTW